MSTMLRSVAASGALARSLCQRKNQLVARQLAGKSVGLSISRLIRTTGINNDQPPPPTPPDHHSHYHHKVEVYDPKWIDTKKPRGPVTAQDFADWEKNKHWESYGFDAVDKQEDRLYFHASMFVFITIGCISFAYGIYYFPDYHLGDWAQREAFMLIDQREKAGLPLINPNVVDPSLITLPTEEEIAGYEVYM